MIQLDIYGLNCIALLKKLIFHTRLRFSRGCRPPFATSRGAEPCVGRWKNWNIQTSPQVQFWYSSSDSDYEWHIMDGRYHLLQARTSIQVYGTEYLPVGIYYIFCSMYIKSRISHFVANTLIQCIRRQHNIGYSDHRQTKKAASLLCIYCTSIFCTCM